MKKAIRVISISFICLSILLSAAWIQNEKLAEKSIAWQQEKMTNLPREDRVKMALLGFHETFAHYLWIQTIIYFGDHYSGDGEFKWLVQCVDIITRLHPHFFPAYEFAGVMIPDVCHNPDAARVILERGLFHLGDKRWNMGFYLGMIYYKYYKDNIRAAECFLMAARVPSPHRQKLLNLATFFLSKSKTPNDIIERSLMGFMYQTSESPDVKFHLRNKIEDENTRLRGK